MRNLLKNSCLFIVLIGLFSNCVNDTYDTPNLDSCADSTLIKTKEVTDMYAIAINPVSDPTTGIPNTPIYSEDDIIEAYVISSDEGGNFYKSMYCQPKDGSKGFNLSVDEGNLYSKNMEPGRKVFLKLKGLAYANPTGSSGRGLVFGATPTDKYTVDRVPALDYKNHLIPSCEVVSEEDIVHKITIDQAFSDTYLNTLVDIEGVQFKTDCASYSQADYDTSLKITNGVKSLDLRTSRYANFAGYSVPSGNGTIRGVLTKYSSTYQIIIRTQRDVKLNNPRVQTVLLPKVGADLQYLGAFTENFESYTATTTGAAFPKYINDAAIGSKYWDVASFSSNKYIKASAYNSGCSKAYFIVPVDFSSAKNISFKSQDGYNDGDPLKVYYSTDYIPGANVSQATLVDITSKFKISTGNTTGYAASFLSSGTYTFPETLMGNGYVIFEYNGTTGITTTMQIDDIVVK